MELPRGRNSQRSESVWGVVEEHDDGSQPIVSRHRGSSRAPSTAHLSAGVQAAVHLGEGRQYINLGAQMINYQYNIQNLNLNFGTPQSPSVDPPTVEPSSDHLGRHHQSQGIGGPQANLPDSDTISIRTTERERPQNLRMLNRIYVYSLLGLFDRGYPLYFPGLHVERPARHQACGISPGDVGLITPEGDFKGLFNILGVNAPANEGIPLPANFMPLATTIRTTRQALVATESLYPQLVVECENIPHRVRFRSRAPEAGVLHLPRGGIVQSLDCGGTHLALYARRNVRDWYNYAERDRRFSVCNGSIYLIDSCDKTNAWGIAVFINCHVGMFRRQEILLDFRTENRGDAGVMYTWESNYDASTRIDVTSGPSQGYNQCTFIRGYKLLLRERRPNKPPKITIFLSHLFGNLFCLPKPEKRSDRRTSSQETKNTFSGPAKLVKEGSQNSIASGSETDGPTHPLDVINEFLLQEIPGCEVAITHDNDWMRILNDAKSRELDLETSELKTSINRLFNICNDDGAAYLKFKGEDEVRVKTDESLVAPQSLEAPLKRPSEASPVQSGQVQGPSTMPSYFGKDIPSSLIAKADMQRRVGREGPATVLPPPIPLIAEAEMQRRARKGGPATVISPPNIPNALISEAEMQRKTQKGGSATVIPPLNPLITEAEMPSWVRKGGSATVQPPPDIPISLTTEAEMPRRARNGGSVTAIPPPIPFIAEPGMPRRDQKGGSAMVTSPPDIPEPEMQRRVRKGGPAMVIPPPTIQSSLIAEAEMQRRVGKTTVIPPPDVSTPLIAEAETLRRAGKGGLATVIPPPGIPNPLISNVEMPRRAQKGESSTVIPPSAIPIPLTTEAEMQRKARKGGSAAVISPPDIPKSEMPRRAWSGGSAMVIPPQESPNPLIAEGEMQRKVEKGGSATVIPPPDIPKAEMPRRAWSGKSATVVPPPDIPGAEMQSKVRKGGPTTVILPPDIPKAQMPRQAWSGGSAMVTPPPDFPIPLIAEGEVQGKAQKGGTVIPPPDIPKAEMSRRAWNGEPATAIPPPDIPGAEMQSKARKGASATVIPPPDTPKAEMPRTAWNGGSAAVIPHPEFPIPSTAQAGTRGKARKGGSTTVLPPPDIPEAETQRRARKEGSAAVILPPDIPNSLIAKAKLQGGVRKEESATVIPTPAASPLRVDESHSKTVTSTPRVLKKGPVSRAPMSAEAAETTIAGGTIYRRGAKVEDATVSGAPKGPEDNMAGTGAYKDVSKQETGKLGGGIRSMPVGQNEVTLKSDQAQRRPSGHRRMSTRLKDSEFLDDEFRTNVAESISVEPSGYAPRSKGGKTDKIKRT